MDEIAKGEAVVKNQTLSDGSKVFNVLVRLSSGELIEFCCESEESANTLSEHIADCLYSERVIT